MLSVVTFIPLLSLLYLLAYIIYRRHFHPLARLPRPLLASPTGLYAMMKPCHLLAWNCDSLTQQWYGKKHRLSPTFQHPSPRMTPLPGEPRYPPGVDGTEIPAGEAVSVSVYSLHHNPDVWGADADDFRPTRWLEDQKTRGNEGLLMHFGQGHRACIGRNQSLIMLWKAAVEVLRRFDIVLADEKAIENKTRRLRVTGLAELKDRLEVRVRQRNMGKK